MPPLSLRSPLRAGLAAAAIALLSACGGGGGASGGPPPSGSTGFIPAPGALGATLYARGTDVRPVRAGAQWVYHSHDYLFGASDYSTKAVAGASASQVVETTANDPDSATTLTAEADGSVLVSATIALDNRTHLTIGGFEVRSPVRTNDQYVLFDGSVSNVDADGDGRPDGVKIAYWRVVGGNEAIDLPNRPAATTAVRIDSFIVVEITPSGGGAPVRVDASTSTWYEPGVGAVRLTLPSTSPSRDFDAEDLLTGWNGVTEGRGYITQPEQHVDPMLTPLRSAAMAVALDDGVLVSTASGLHRLDRNGVFQETLPSPPIPSYYLFRSGRGIQALTGSFPALQVHAFDDRGRYVAPVTAFDFSNGRPGTISDTRPTYGFSARSSWLWFAWLRSYFSGPGQASDEVVLRAVAADGSSILPELAFPVPAFMDGSSIRLSTQAGGTLLTWNEPDGSGATKVHAVGVSNAGAVTFETSPASIPAPQSGMSSTIEPVSDASTTWLVWRVGRQTSPGTVIQEPHGATLDAMGNATGGAGPTELPDIVDPAVVDWSRSLAADSGHLFATGDGFGTVFADMPATNLISYADFSAGAGPLASTITRSAAYRIPGVSTEPSLYPIVFPDRVLILSQTGNYFLRPTVIWR